MKTPIFEYENYTDYLEAAGQHLGVAGRRLSHQSWADYLGYRSPRSIGMVLTGRRLPSPQMIQRLSQRLELSEKEHRYFELLIEKEKKQRLGFAVSHIQRQLKTLKPGRGEITIFESDRIPLIAEWYYLVLKQWVGSPSFQPDPVHIYRKLKKKVRVSTIREALRRMVQFGILEKDLGQKKYSVRKRSVRTPDDVPSGAGRLHHIQMLQRSIEAVQEQPLQEREFLSFALRFDQKRIAEAKKFIRQFREDFDRRFFSDGASDVYQLNVQLFSHTEHDSREVKQ